MCNMIYKEWKQSLYLDIAQLIERLSSVSIDINHLIENVFLFLNHPYQGCIGIAIHMRNVYTAIKAEGYIHSSLQPTWKKKESEMDSSTYQMMHKIKSRLSLFQFLCVLGRYSLWMCDKEDDLSVTF